MWHPYKLKPLRKSVNRSYDDLCDPFVDFNPDCVWPALADCYLDGLDAGALIGIALSISVYGLVKAGRWVYKTVQHNDSKLRYEDEESL